MPRAAGKWQLGKIEKAGSRPGPRGRRRLRVIRPAREEEPMRCRATFLALGTLAALACSTLRTSVDYDRSLDFSRYRTFAFRTGTPARRETTQRRIEQVIAASLETRGLMQVVGERPDLRIFTHVVVENDRRIDTIVYGYGWRSGGIVTTNVITIPVGTLIVDLVDPVSYTHLRAHETRHDLVCR